MRKHARGTVDAFIAMDFLDVFMYLLPPYGGPSSRERSREENLSGGVAMVLLPILDFIVVLFAGAWKDAALSMFLLPALCTFAIVLLSRWLQTSGAWTLKVAIGCLLSCLVCSGVASLLAGVASFYSTF